MADLARHSAPPSAGSENIGDVLASIRRLIAQDEANGLSETTARRLGALHQRSEKAPVADLPPSQSMHPADETPLVLGNGDFIGPIPEAVAASGAESALPLDAVGNDIQTADPEPEMEPLLSIPSFAHAEAQEQEDTAALEQVPTTIINEQVDNMIQQAHATTPTQLHPALDSLAAPISTATIEEPRNLFLMEEEEFIMPDTPLRGMIRETLVQELQGEFGDQFSRKLRNLVRAEIAMALKEAIKG